jgi:hypothetical protein
MVCVTALAATSHHRGLVLHTCHQHPALRELGLQSIRGWLQFAGPEELLI